MRRLTRRHVIDEAAIEEAVIEEAAVDEIAAIEAVDAEIEVPSDPTPIATAAVVADSAADDAVDEPAGWAAAPRRPPHRSKRPPSPAEEVGRTDLATQVVEPEPVPVVEEPAPVESTVPAGWYADPSGRYELRYWDGICLDRARVACGSAVHRPAGCLISTATTTCVRPRSATPAF